MPVHPYGFGTDSSNDDDPAIMETTLRATMVALSECDILGGAGQINTATAVSPIQLIIDDTLAKILKKSRSGVKVDEDNLAWQELLNISPGEHFLKKTHTLKHCREALRTDLITPSPESRDLSKKSTIYANALEKYMELKKEFKPLPLPEDVQKELNRIVKHADEHLVR